jgi:hypothetical protein
MKITYEQDGKEKTLTYKDGVWSGTDFAAVLNASFTAFLGRHSYFPTAWHEAKAVADKLGGTLDEEEPEAVDIDPNVVY